MTKLKVDLHTHTAEDPYEYIKYDARQLIDRASQVGIDALAITNHNTVTYNTELAGYAEKKGILLIPGMEAVLSGKHVLIINPDFRTISQDRSLKDLEKIKNKKNLIIAPHPFFPNSRSLKSNLFSYLHVFDAIEFCHFYNHLIDCNKKAVRAAKQYKKPQIGTSDCHNIWQFGTTYSLVEAEKNIPSIINAIKKGKIEIHTTPVSLFTMSRVAINFFLIKRLKALRRR
jgi:predicted metal-dependent phosphoesterase TrpH